MKLLIVHAQDEADIAERLAPSLREAGYEVLHEGTILIGESFTEEISKFLIHGGPIVLCGTVKAVGTRWAHRLVNSTRQNVGVRLFAVQMEQDAYMEQLSLGTSYASYWQDPSAALRELIGAINRYFPVNGSENRFNDFAAEMHYRQIALESCDIIDLANLPENDRHLATKQLELRRLYVALHAHAEITADDIPEVSKLQAMEARRERKIRFQYEQIEDQQRVTIGSRLVNNQKLVVLGDPGAGKSTLLRWIATAYLLRLKQDPDWQEIPHVTSLPDEEWLPIIVRCRDLDANCLGQPLDEILYSTLRRAEMPESECATLRTILRRRLEEGKALLLIDGLDEISDPDNRIRFCQQIEQINTVLPEAPIIVTSRIVGYREIGYRIGRGFEHITIADLSGEEKDDFAARWCAVTELPENHTRATEELIKDIHSTARIEQLTGNPMLLTTMALVKRSIGKLPSRRADLYSSALEVLLNWRREVDKPLDSREAIPQLEYLAYAMCDRGTQQLREDEVLDLLERMREEYSQIRAIQQHTPEQFLHLLESRTGIVVQTGHVRYNGWLVPVFEFRHLTFQEYLAGMALVERRFPGKDRSLSLAEIVAPLAGRLSLVNTPNKQSEEAEVTENWREAIRLCVASCNDDDVDSVLEAIVTPRDEEDAAATSRPRTVLAALCLADDPNASNDICKTILLRLLECIKPSDGRLIGYSSVDNAVGELALSNWAVDLGSLLLDEYMKRQWQERSSYGRLCGIIGGENAPNDNTGFNVWLDNQLLRMSEGEAKAVHAALSITVSIFSGKALLYEPDAEVIKGIIKAALEMLNESPPASEAAADLLLALTSPLMGNTKWKPDEIDTTAVLSCVENPSFDPGAVISLIDVLGSAKESRVINILLDRLLSPIKTIRSASIRALGKLGASEAFIPLMQMFDNNEIRNQIDIVHALGKIGDVRATQLLIQHLDSQEDNLVVACVEALANICPQDEQISVQLIKLLDHESEEVVSTVILAFGQLHSQRGYDAVFSKLAAETDRTKIRFLCKHLEMSAYKLFHSNDIEFYVEVMRRVVEHDPSNHKRNNLAYGLIILGLDDLAEEQFHLMHFSDRDANWPLYAHNHGILSVLRGDLEAGVNILRNIWNKISSMHEYDMTPVSCMLVLRNSSSVQSVNDIPMDAALVINLYVIGYFSTIQMESILSDRYPTDWTEWSDLVVSLGEGSPST